MVEILANDMAFEIKEGEKVKYNLQVSDIFNLAEVKSSYLDSFKIKKTAHNTRIMQGLGLVGDTSTIPYNKINASLNYFGASVVHNGWLSVKETSEDYSISIIDGIIDFFKAIEGKTLGSALDLTAINHIKSVSKVEASQDNYNYKYILADYGGKVRTDDNNINIDYLVPSVRVSYLLNLIGQTFGYNFTGDILTNSDLLDLFLTYPKPPVETGAEVAELYFEGTKENVFFDFLESLYIYTGSPFAQISKEITQGVHYIDNVNSFTSVNLIQGQVVDNWKYVVSENGNYKIEMFLDADVTGTYYVQYIDAFGGTSFSSYTRSSGISAKLIINGIEVNDFRSTNIDKNKTFYYNLNAGDVVSLRYFFENSRAYNRMRYNHTKTKLSVSKTNIGGVDFSEALADFSIKDFIKELFWRYGITPIINQQKRTIFLQTFKEKVNSFDYVDWSEKYIKRKKENYTIASFAQNNYLKHKYNGTDESFNDGVIKVDNKNIDENRDLLIGKTYSSEKGFTEIELTSSAIMANIFPIWLSEVKEKAGVLEVNYKPLANRFYFTKATRLNAPLTIGSELLGGTSDLTSVFISNLQNVYFNALSAKYYDKHESTFNNLRIHEIELNLSISDIINIDFSKKYYFQQEGQYYILNKLNFELGRESIGEFIRVK